MPRHVTPKGHGLGWKPQLPDHRDCLYTYRAPLHIAQDLPPKAEVAQFPIFDQGQLGSCTGNGIAFAVLFDAVKQGLLQPTDVPSRLFIYWGERDMEGTTDSDAGANIRDGIQFVAKNGVCLESGPDSWPYDTSQFTVCPPDSCWQAAVKFEAVQYQSVPQVAQSLRGCIAEGYPVVFGFTCYEGLESEDATNTGMVPMPGPQENPLGGHCVAAVAYDDSTRLFKCRNSWSDQWGDHGYFYLPYEYLLRPDLSSDFWTIRLLG